MKRLRFRAWRRGFKEADLVLGGFADAHAEALSPQDLARFEALLDESDLEVFTWIAGLVPAPAVHDHELLGRIRDYAVTHCAHAIGART